MPKKTKLLEKLYGSGKNFTIRELDALMGQCGCEKFSGGRGSGIRYVHTASKRVLQFDGPHPGNTLYSYQVKKVLRFLNEIGETEEGGI